MGLKETRLKAKKLVWFFRQQRTIQSTSLLKGFVGAKISTQFNRRQVLEGRDFFEGYQADKP